jgi:3-oxoacyl-[acyl-carrier protein] reductase
MKFKDKVAIITGSGQGIGKRIAEGLAAEGACVIISDVNFDAAMKTSQELKTFFHVRTSCIKSDVMKKEEVQSLMEHTMKDFGQIDILVNNAGIVYLTKVEEISEKEWDEVLNVNLRGVFFCCQAVTPLMKKQRKGRILNMSSIAGKSGGISSGAHYAASKAGVICLTKVFARELAPFGVTVNALAPGPVDSPMTLAFPEKVREDLAKNCPLGRLADIDDIAEAALFLLSDASKHITGEILDVNGGLLMD